MDFALTDDQLALQSAVARFCTDTFPIEHRGRPETDAENDQRQRAMAELGLLGLALPAAHGGSELGATETMLAAQELGRVMAGGSWLASAVMAGSLIRELGSSHQQDRWLPQLARGELQAAVACQESAARHALDEVHTRAQAAADGWQLSGRKACVLAGDTAQLLLVAARTEGVANDPHGISLFALQPGTPGLRVQGFNLLDGRRAAHLYLDGVTVTAGDRLGRLDEALPALQTALARAEAALCADSAGAADALLGLCCEHLNTRQQFGQPLARFQALQHDIAEMTMSLEQIRSMACVAALATEAEEADERDRLLSAARCLIAQLGRQIAWRAIQLHGAMGMTDECLASHLAKRLITNSLLFGDAAAHLQRFAARATSARSTPTTTGLDA
jgi:alkylation response protein AidB-like acyl-CoA dehydrogenase